jgi:membrane protein YdbS with pleckstrin-like domain
MGSHDPEQYLLPSERRVVRIRRHWTVVAWDVLEAVILVVVAKMIAYLVPAGVSVVQDVLWYVTLLIILRMGYKLFEWWDEKFVVTDKRFVLITGVLRTRVAMMPLSKVTDLTYERSAMARMLGYGTIVVESAGQIQAFHRIEHLPEPERVYDVISELVFGDRKAQQERFSMMQAQRKGRLRRSTL